ncbi:hypothetical protein ETD86_10780 [Nonomuraea turkmeniaca]|uniref:OmpR/PhoB-type domain-containing protein n=1 Tax=Nonomuraea turkmeniaca TaxID=103838 RepID=A0A5S4FQB3_9ACTN|nr:hypothetical protein ETD86_10780 [Nonomuraea turkmeniaca]
MLLNDVVARVGGSPPAFEVLGSLRVWVDGRERAVSRPAVRRLLGALLLTPGRLVDRARLIAFVWGPSGCEPAALHSAVYRLREWLRPSGVEVVRDSDCYRIEVPPEQVDASRFRAAVAGARAEPDPVRRTNLLLAALECGGVRCWPRTWNGPTPCPRSPNCSRPGSTARGTWQRPPSVAGAPPRPSTLCSVWPRRCPTTRPSTPS